MGRLGGFVIHGNEVATLGRCLDSLRAVCDEVVAVDSGSTDGSAELARARGVRRVVLPWQGYGAARAAGARALAGCDHLLFLDADEWLDPEAIAGLRAWRASDPRGARYTLAVRDWADLDFHRFAYRVERHVRIVRADGAAWTPAMVVHEALPAAPATRLPVTVEHRFASSLAERAGKLERYALLWAIRNADGPRRAKPAGLQRAFHVLRDCVAKGAALRGGLDAWRLAWAVSRYHARKYELLREVRDGLHPDLLEAYRARAYRALFAALGPPSPGSEEPRPPQRQDPELDQRQLRQA